MTLKLKFLNPINNTYEDFIINYPIIDYGYFKRIFEYNNDNDLINILNETLNELDCTIEYNGFRMRSTNQFIYQTLLSDYYFYLIKLNNQILYNKYLDKLIKRHSDNLEFEYNNPYNIYHNYKNKNKKEKTKRKKLPPNRFFQQITQDIFTGEKSYIYINPRTEEEIISNNPNLLDKLNNKKSKKVKSNKQNKAGVPISSMTFSFKKK